MSSRSLIALSAGIFCIFSLVVPADAIVTAGSDPNADVVNYGDTPNGVNTSGVVEITSSIGGCTGSLLTGGMSILTAGHCVTSAYGSAIATNITVYFQGPGDVMIPLTVSAVAVDPGYTGDSTQGSDLAVLTLSNPAPAFATGYSLYTSDLDVPTTVELVGYGNSGTGLTGADNSFGTLRAGENVLEGAASQYFNGWSSQLLVGQFYDGTICQQTQSGRVCTNTNALGVANPYQSADEVDTAHGDSGGPAFYDGEIVGVTDLGVCYSSSQNSSICATGPAGPSLSQDNDSYFGEMFADTSVADNLAFIEAAEAPEPGSATLMLCALCVVLEKWRRKRKQTVSVH